MSAFLRLVLITVISVIFLGAGLLGLRIAGSLQSFEKVHHPWMERNFLLILNKECSLAGLERSQQEQPDAILTLNLKPKEDETWEVECEPAYPLGEVLRKMPKGSFIFNINSSGDLGFENLKRDLKALENNRSVGLMSPSHTVSKRLRKEFPQWLFGADPTTLVKLHLYEALFIETMADVWPDFFVTGPDPRAPEFLAARLVQELVRRKKLIIWNDDDPNQTIPSSLYPQVNGVMTKRPTWAIEAFRSRF